MKFDPAQADYLRERIQTLLVEEGANSHEALHALIHSAKWVIEQAPNPQLAMTLRQKFFTEFAPS